MSCYHQPGKTAKNCTCGGECYDIYIYICDSQVSFGRQMENSLQNAKLLVKAPFLATDGKAAHYNTDCLGEAGWPLACMHQ